LRREILKRSRKARSEITNFPETARLLDIVLNELGEEDLVFDFEYSTARDTMRRIVGITGAKCIPGGEKVTWKDLRSSMACDLLKKGWTLDEVNKRLGHKPSSDEIDKYVNFLALDGHKSKKKIFENSLAKLQQEIDLRKTRERMQADKIELLEKQLEAMSQKQLQLFEMFNDLDVKKSKIVLKAVYDELTG
jgi:hypothetical protein